MTKVKEVLTCENAPKAVGPYSVGIRSGDFLFLSGQLGIDPATGKFAPGGVEEQTHQALTNIKAVLEENGAGLSDVVKTSVFLKDINDFLNMNAVYATFFESAPPARSAMQVGALPLGGLVEIEVVVRI